MRKIIIFIAIFLIIIIGFFYFFNNPILPKNTIKFKCPEEYTEDKTGMVQYRENVINWTSEFFEANPKADISDWLIAKSKLWKDNNCIIAIQRSKMSGKVADLKQWELVDYEIQNALDKAINSTN